MRKAILSVLILLSFTACAQRLQTRPKTGAAAAAEKAKDGAKSDAVVEKVDKPAQDGSAQADKKSPTEQIPVPTEIETIKTGGTTQPTLPPEEVKTVPAPSTEKVSNCAVEFAALSEKDAADIMTKFAGSWIEGGINTVRNVVPSSDTSDIKRTVITLGPKNEENSISRLTFKQAKEIIPGKSPYEVTATESIAKVMSYRVSAPIDGFNLVELVTSSPSGVIQCSTFGFKFEAGPARAQDALHSLAPIKEVKITAEEYVATNKAKAKILSSQ